MSEWLPTVEMIRTRKVGYSKWYAVFDVPGLPGRPARYEMGLGPFLTERTARRAMVDVVKDMRRSPHA